MNGNQPLWGLIAIIALPPLLAVLEIVAAVFSSRVRAFILKHPIAHFLLFALALALACLLFPVFSTRHGGF